MLAYRMVTVASAITDEVLNEISQKRFPPSYFFENKFFVGSGVDKDKRLTVAGQTAVLDILREDLDMGRGLSRDVFLQEYCQPMRKQEIWLAWLKKSYGALADRASVQRLES